MIVQKLGQDCQYFIYYLFILTANGILPGGSDTTIRHNTNNTTIKRNTAHKTTHTIKDTTQNEYNHNYNYVD
jgi:hypothetical protein